MHGAMLSNRVQCRGIFSGTFQCGADVPLPPACNSGLVAGVGCNVFDEAAAGIEPDLVALRRRNEHAHRLMSQWEAEQLQRS